MIFLHPRSEQIDALTSGPMDQPLVMLNLLKFHDQAQYPEDTDYEACSGEEAYGRYALNTFAHLTKRGGKILLQVPVEEMIIGPDDKEWHSMLIVYYPTRAAFIDMINDPDYQAGGIHRTAALADSRLMQCDGSKYGV